LGASQIGKTALINDILFLEGDERGKEGGEGISTTKEDKTYSSKVLNHIKITDSCGFEVANNYLEKWFENYKHLTQNNIKEGNFDELIHCIWYGVSGNLISDEEIESIRQMHSLLDKFEVPIIFVNLKPFNIENTRILKKRTSLINNNFISVQPRYYEMKCKEDEKDDCFSEGQKFFPYNMDKLLYMTKNLATEGIINSVTSRVIHLINNTVTKSIEKKFKQKSLEFEKKIKNIYKNFEINKSPDITYDRLDEIRENFLGEIYELIELTLFDSKKKVTKETKDLINSIQKKIENSYKTFFKNIFDTEYEEIIKKMDLLKKTKHKKQNDKTYFGCSELKEEDFKSDIDDFIKKFNSGYLIQISALKKSLEKINEVLYDKILLILKSNIIEIISELKLSNKLEEKIKSETKKRIKKNLLDPFDEEIKSAFSKK